MWTRDFLFIGGELDGQWLPVKLNTFGKPESHWEVTIAPKYPSVIKPEAKPIKAVVTRVQQQIYKREQLNCEQKTWYFYIPAEVEVVNILGELLRGYKRQGKEGEK